MFTTSGSRAGRHALNSNVPQVSGSVEFLVKLSANTVLSVGVATLVNFDTIERDTAGGFNTVTHKYTIPTTGVWVIQAQLGISGSAPTSMGVQIFKNNVEIHESDIFTGGSSSISSPSITRSVSFTAGDIVDCRGFISGTGGNARALDVLTWFGGYYLHP